MKLFSEFHREKSRKNGYGSSCKECNTEKNMQCWIAHKGEKIKANPEKVKASINNYRKKQAALEVDCACGGYYTGLTRAQHMKTKMHAAIAL